MSNQTIIQEKASNLLATLYVYARQLQGVGDELARTKDDQNIITCRPEYIYDIWGVKLNQPFTSDFDIATYRTLLTALARACLTDSTKENIKNVVKAYFPVVSTQTVVAAELYSYTGDYTFLNQPVISINSVEVDSGSGYVLRLASDYYLRKSQTFNIITVDNTNTIRPVGSPTIINGITITAGDRVWFAKLADSGENEQVWEAIGTGTNITSWLLVGDRENTLDATDVLQFIANVPTLGNSVRVSYTYDSLNVEVVEYWKNPEKMTGYDWQNQSMFWGGVGYSSVSNPERNWVVNKWNQGPTPPDLLDLGYFRFGVQILISGIGTADLPVVENYLVPQLNTIVKPAGIYYKVLIVGIRLLVPDKVRSSSIRYVYLQNLLGFGLSPFGSPTPAPANDTGFGEPDMPLPLFTL